MNNTTTAKHAPWWAPMIVPIVVIIVISVCYQAMANYLSVYVLQYLKGSATAYGLVGTGWTIIAMILRPSTGPLSQKFGSKTMLIIGLAIFAAMIACCGILLTFTGFVFFRLIQCVGHAWSYTSSNSLAAEAVPQSRMGTASSLFIGIPQAAAIVAGPWVAEALIGDDQNWFRFFVGIAAIMVAGLVLALIFVPGRKKHASDPGAAAKAAAAAEAARYDADGKPYTGIWKFLEKTSIPACITMIVASMAHCTMFFLTAYVAATYEGVSAAVFFTAQAVTEFLCRFWMGAVQDRKGLKVLLVPCCIICAVVYVCIAQGVTAWVVLGLVYGVGQAGIKAPLNASLMKACPANRIPVANGTFQMSNAVGLGLATLVAGVVIDAAGFTGMWYYCVALFILTAVLGVVLIREKNVK
ncbi:MFS transporter [Lawsonibacter hominis]|uniref:MFS transporter n=1 Tax=Lawsonibacter hominis TaxID=2763053 RepID=A0A8J6IZE0_9FIRM|nr:MFS transporter [Lawsonibacter hominis]MBC5732367.1 MFS transporter [Lawsonibacter hominis]